LQNGAVILSGPILKSEVDRLLKRVAAMRSVKNVEHRLEAHGSAEGVPALQGAARAPGGERLDVLQTHWSPATRLIAGVAAAALVLAGGRRHGIVDAASSFLGVGLLARALTNMEFKRLFGIGAGPFAVTVQKIIDVAAPVERVFSFWMNYENFPRFMRNIREVRSIGDHRSHWVAAGPAGAPIEWDAEITRYVPNRLLAWRTLPDSPIQHAGTVRFVPNRDGTTRLDIRISYSPAAGALGHAVATIFGADPKTEMDEDLARVKTLIETGRPPHDAARKEQLQTAH
jgi:uncharacterized membrane protein